MVSESSGTLKVKILNKTGKSGQIGVRTQETPDCAKPGKDFDPIDTIVEFKKENSKQVEVIIHDDDQWEPDKEFKVVLY